MQRYVEALVTYDGVLAVRAAYPDCSSAVGWMLDELGCAPDEVLANGFLVFHEHAPGDKCGCQVDARPTVTRGPRGIMRSLIRELPCWLTYRWDRPEMAFFLKATADGLEHAAVPRFTLGITYALEDPMFWGDTTVGMVESGLLLSGVWDHNGRPTYALDELWPMLDDPYVIVATDKRGLMLHNDVLPHLERRLVWFPERYRGTLFVVQPSRFRLWEEDRWGAHNHFRVLYGGAALPTAVLAWKEDA